MCQAYIRHPVAELKNNSAEIKIVGELISLDSSSVAIKRHVDEITNNINENNINKSDQESAMKVVKLLERKRRKHERIERKQRYIENNLKRISKEAGEEFTAAPIKKTKYVYCGNCKNPKSENCEHNLCRKCCKDKVFTEKIECKGKLFLFC